MKLPELISLLEEIAPPELAEDMDYGKIGLCVRGSVNVRKVATALDATPKVIRSAISMKAQALVVHHPLIWDPVNLIPDDLAWSLKHLLKNDISLYAMHTNYDMAPGGVNDVLADIIGLKDVKETPHGRAGTISPVSIERFAGMVSERLEAPVEYIGERGKKIKSVAIVAGSGFRPGLQQAKEINADALLSSEMKHDVIRMRGDVALVSAPHYHTEAPAMKALADRLKGHVPAVFIDDVTDIRVVPGVERRRV